MNRILPRISWKSVGQLPAASLLIAAGACLIVLCPPLAAALQYDPGAVRAGELWRIVTCHLTHWSTNHLFWDAGALVALGSLVEPDHRRALLTCLAASAVLIPLSIWTCLPELATYRGLSGIDSAVFFLLAMVILRPALSSRDWAWAWITAAVLAGFLAKIAFEVVTDATLFVDSAGAKMLPVPLAHIVGAIVGTVCGLWSSTVPEPPALGQAIPGTGSKAAAS